MSETQVAEPVDVFAMSADEFSNLDFDSFGSEESTSVDSIQEEPTEEVNPLEEQVYEDDHLEDVIEEDTEIVEEEEEIEEEEVLEETTEPTDSIDYESEYKKLIGSPIKANGKEITIDSIEDAQRLMQMGLNYNKNMESLKPARKIIAMLEQNEMLSEEKLGFAIDLINKNPQAINKLINESGIDKYDLDETEGDNYKPTDYSVSEQDLNLDNALKDISSTPTYTRTVNVLGKEWDNASREHVKSNPEVIGIINEHMASGLFDTVNQEVEKQKMLGRLPSGMSNLQAYKYVGDMMYAQSNTQQTPSGQSVEALQANAPKPAIRRPTETVIKNKQASSKPRGKPSVTEQFEDVFSMSSSDFSKKYL